MSASAPAISETPQLDLSALRAMSYQELDALYRAGKKPNSISDLDGDAQGAMLAWRSPQRGPIARMLRAFGESSVFPWNGKSFHGVDNATGEGINRISFFGKRRWFPFGTRFQPSFLDDQPAFILDYARPGNPPLIRSIVDEVREVAPRLYLGPAALKVRGRPRPILFFAVSLQESKPD
ncbi:MAG TPA: hypothetical protein VJT71_04720 [Pyrinomonadaceae bacterium]|nr:hypothetical protein [Pyrinomonadaceae bacterium]